MEKKQAPFGVASKRFGGIGFHPGLDPTGCMMKNKSTLGPGSYDPVNFECGYKGGSSWARKAEVEDWSKHLGYRNAHVLNQRMFMRSQGGPGSYDIPENVFKKQHDCAMRNVGFGRQKRFWNPIKDTNPPPGTYSGKDIAKISTMTHKQFTDLPIFEWDGFIDRFRDKAPGWVLPPNRYVTKDAGSIKALLDKTVSKRGPYDLFTGPRDGSTIKNHFAPPSFKGPLNWFRTWPSQLDDLLRHPNYRRNGKFLKASRSARSTLRHMLNDLSLCYRDPDEPSPCHYDLSRKSELKQNRYPFNKSVTEARPPVEWKIYPGVGRYSPQLPKCTMAPPGSWVFRSRTKRTEYKAVEYNAF